MLIIKLENVYANLMKCTENVHAHDHLLWYKQPHTIARSIARYLSYGITLNIPY